MDSFIFKISILLFVMTSSIQFWKKSCCWWETEKKLDQLRAGPYRCNLRLAYRELEPTLVWIYKNDRLFKVWSDSIPQHQQFFHSMEAWIRQAVKIRIHHNTSQQVDLFKLGHFASIFNCESLLSVKIWGYMCLKKIISCRKKSCWIH